MRSLRGRLTLGVALVVAVLLLAAGAVASHYVASSERAALDDRLERTAELSRATALATIQEGLPDPDRRLDDVLSASGTSLRLTLGGRVVLDTGAPPAARPRLRRGLQTFDSGGKRYRAYVTALRDPGLGGLARLEVVSALAPLEHRQARLEHRLLALGLIALVAAGVGRVAGGRPRAAPAAPAADRGLQRGRRRGSRSPRAARRFHRAALTRGELQRDARPPRALGRRPRARRGSVAHAVRRVVAGTAEPERHGADGVLAELARWHQTGAPRGDAEHERTRAADQRAVEIEERRAGPGTEVRSVTHCAPPPGPGRTPVAWAPRVGRRQRPRRLCDCGRRARRAARSGSRRR